MNDYRAYIETNYNTIYHHGIKGQRWGLRRYQNPDGSLTPEGRRHYGLLIKQYKKAGMSDKEIQEAIAKRNKIVKGAAIGAGALALGAGAFYAHRYLGGKYLDKTIKAGQKLQTIGSTPERLKNQHFYAAKGFFDENRYISELGEKKGFFGYGIGEYKKKIVSTARNNVKLASQKNQVEVFKDVMTKDESFLNDFKKLNLMPKKDLINIGVNKHVINGNDLAWKLNEGKVNVKHLSKKDWEDLGIFYNFTQIGHADELKPMQNKYFDALKKRGYGGMIDLNDSLHNGFHSKSAAIVFDNKQFMQTSVKDLTAADVNKARTIDLIRQLGEAYIPYLPFYAFVGGGVAAKASDNKAMNEAKRRNQNK